ncbi:MAG: alanyl-tRNA editing protein, partial [Spirochaetales bacterium]|nr:alanyl-tRNA editing protein [Spirochaetales bacterium]
KLYYQDPRMESFQARLVHQEQEGDHWIVVLDRTAFYPEGGGQPADRGRLNGIPVIDIREREGEVCHVLPEALLQDVPVQGTIDFPTRFDFMQQHTGQHIISASLIEAAGYPTISAYLGDSYTAVEIDIDSIQDAEIEAAEVLANRTVTRNLPVHIHWIQPEEAERFSLRKPPPNVQRLRIVEIEGVDSAACAGIHVEKTGEVGLIKFDGLEKIRGRLRLHWLIGDRAYRDVREKDRLATALNRELTCGTADILASVRELKNALRAREQRISQLEKTLAGYRAQGLLASAASEGGIRLVREIFAAEEPSFVQTVYQNILAGSKTVACLINHRKDDIQWWIGCSEDLDIPWKQIVPGLFPLIEGKGGGKGGSWQGIGKKAGKATGFLDSLGAAIWKHLQGTGSSRNKNTRGG